MFSCFLCLMRFKIFSFGPVPAFICLNFTTFRSIFGLKFSQILSNSLVLLTFYLHLTFLNSFKNIFMLEWSCSFSTKEVKKCSWEVTSILFFEKKSFISAKVKNMFHASSEEEVAVLQFSKYFLLSRVDATFNYNQLIRPSVYPSVRSSVIIYFFYYSKLFLIILGHF